METQSERLRWAREKKGFENASDAARAFGWRGSTYLAHENGQNGLRRETAERYADAFGVSAAWLLTGEGGTKRGGVPIVGLAGANPNGTVLYAESQGELGEAPVPPGATAKTVALEVRGHSMRGIAEEGWLVYYDDRRDPPSDDLFGDLCVVGLSTGEVLVKRLLRGSRRGLFNLESMAAPLRENARVEWAAPVTAIVPSRPRRR